MLKTKNLINEGGQVDNLIKGIQRESPTAFSQLQERSKALVQEYMTANYDIARQKYYDLVKAAELLVAVQRTAVLNNELDLNVDTIINIMIKVAEALVFRAESYTCPPSVIHVVRVLQANPDSLKEKKYKVNYPVYCEGKLKTNKAFCNIGTYGYLISILEQFGYIYRFHITYCLTGNAEKCKKKIDEKYIPRVINAVEILSKKSQKGGRKRRTRRVKKRKNKRSRKR